MRLIPVKLSKVRLAVVLLQDRLAVAAIAGERTETFSIAAENPAAVLREELTNRQLIPRMVSLALPRTSVFVRPMELPTVGGDIREMVRLNLDGHLPFATDDDTAFDFAPLPAEANGEAQDELLQRVLVAAAEPRVIEAALRIAEEARLRPASVTVASHDLLALARPERGQRVVWVHLTGATADILCLFGSSLVLSRSVPAPDEATMGEEIRRSLAAVRWRECDAIWVSGDLSVDALGGALPAPVREPAYAARVSDRVAALPVEDRGAHELALGVALARRGRPLDLLPPRLRPRRLSRAQGFTLAVASATALLLITALLVPGLREQRHLNRINTEIARLEPPVRAVERVVRDLERKRKLLGTINGLETSAVRPLPILRELTDLVPTDTWLTTLSLDGKGVELTGQAAAASALIPLLENSPRLERVEFSSPVTRGRDKEQFRIRAGWEAAVAPPAVAPAPAGTPSVGPGARPPRPPSPARSPGARP